MLKAMEVEQQKIKIQKRARYIKGFFLFLGWTSIILTLLIHIPLLISCFTNFTTDSFATVKLFTILTTALQSVIAILILFTIASLFREVSESKSPINDRLIKRFRQISLLLIITFFVIFSSQFIPVDVESTIEPINYFEVGVISNTSTLYLKVNFEYIVAALFCYCLSYIFKYTLYLQQSADDTI